MTPLGYIMLPIGIAGLFFSEKWLYRLFIFWTLFSASAVMNFGAGEEASALSVWMFFGGLWFLRLTLDRLLRFSFSIDRRILRPCLWLIAFLFVAALSLVMPLYINGSLIIASPYLFGGSDVPLFLTWHNVTQLLFLLFGITIAVSVAHANLRNEDRHETERVILLSAVVVSVWGLVQLFCNLTGFPYPDYIFNNSASISAKGYLETVNGISRISSAATEPSVFAQSLLSLLPLTLPAWLNRGSVFSYTIDRSCTVLFIVLLILSTSSTAYVGLFILIPLTLLVYVRTRIIPLTKALKIAAVGIGAGMTAIVLAALSTSIVGDVVSVALLDKSSSSSGLERAMTVALAFGYFQKFPILGVGWGSATSHDLIVKLLSNVGIMGTFTFLGALYCVIRSNWRAMGKLDGPASLSRVAWFIGFMVFLTTCVFAGFPVAYGNFWLVIGMAMSLGWKTPEVPVVALARG